MFAATEHLAWSAGGFDHVQPSAARPNLRLLNAAAKGLACICVMPPLLLARKLDGQLLPAAGGILHCIGTEAPLGMALGCSVAVI